jgi:hypothetical protein
LPDADVVADRLAELAARENAAPLFAIRFLRGDEIFTNKSIDTSVLSCIVRLGTMSNNMLRTTQIHSRLIGATAPSSALLWPNSFVEDTRQPGYGRALVWRRLR